MCTLEQRPKKIQPPWHFFKAKRLRGALKDSKKIANDQAHNL